MTDATRNSLNARISLVRDRLEFVQLITNLNQQFIDPSLTKNNKFDNGWTHPWEHFDSLRNYLLLTCFDLLGQPSEWMDFNSWLNSKKHREEVSRVISLNSGRNDPLEMIKEVNSFYTKQYGVKNSFYRFIDEVIPVKVREALLYSISIIYARQFITYDENGKELGRGSQEVKKIDDDQSKIKFLFWLRNAYTHEATSIGSPARGVWPKEFFSSMAEDGRVLCGWWRIGVKHASEKDHFHDYSVRRWPDVLIETVEAGLAEITHRDSIERSNSPCEK